MKDRLWFYGSYRNARHADRAWKASSPTPTPATRRAGTGSASPIDARLVQDRQMIIGRLTGQVGKSRIRFNSEYQHRCEGTPLKVDTPGLPQARRRLDRPRQQRGAVPDSPEATSTAARGYFDAPFYLNQGAWTMPATSKLLFEAGYQPFRYKPIFGYPPPDGITNLIPVTEQSNAINPATGLQYAPAAELPLSRASRSGAGRSARPTAWHGVGVVRHRRAQREGRLPGQPARPAGSDDSPSQTQLGYRFNQGVPNAVSYWLPDFGRRTITKLHGVYIQDSWTHEPPDAAGRAALRPRLELRAGRRQRHDRQVVVPEPAADHDPARRRASTPTTTSRRASASPTTCSATARRRSSSTGAGTSPTRRTTRRTRRPTRRHDRPRRVSQPRLDRHATATWSSTATC